MTSTVIVRCGDAIRTLLTSARSAEMQTHRPEWVVVVTDPGTPDRALSWIDAAADARGWRHVRAPSTSPAAIWNAAIRAVCSDAYVTLESGDVLDPVFVARCQAALNDDGVDAVITGLVLVDPRGAHRIDHARPAAASVVLPFDVFSRPMMIRRSAWETFSGFEETLATLEDVQLLAAIRKVGRTYVAVDEPLVERRVQRSALYRRRAEPAALAAAVSRVLRTIGPLSPSDAVAALSTRLELRQMLRAQNDAALGRRTHAAADLEVLQAADRLASTPVPALADRTTPVSRQWGFDRGLPIDRRYIEAFLSAHAGDIRGEVLEIKDPLYTARFGEGRVSRSHVLDIDPGNSAATVTADLRCAANVPSESVDCAIVTQTLHLVDDIGLAIAELWRMLRPGGVLLATIPAVDRRLADGADYWRVTPDGARHLFSQVCPPQAITIETFGNVAAASAFLYGVAADELPPETLAVHDAQCPSVVAVRAVKPIAAPAVRRPVTPPLGAAILLYHRVAAVARDRHGLAVPPATFAAHLDYLRRAFDVRPVDEIAQAASEGHRAPGAIGITFDDGYSDNLTIASTLLRASGLPATFFVTTQGLPEGGVYWWDVLDAMFSAFEDRAPVCVDVAGRVISLDLRTAAGRTRAHDDVYWAIRDSPADERDRAVERIGQALGASVACEARRMTADEIATLSRIRAHGIGAHSVTHPVLTAQPRAVQQREIRQSRASLEAITGRRVSIFAYPHGCVDDSVAATVRESGMAFGLCIGEAPLPAGADPFRLPRLTVRADRAERFDDWLHRRLSSGHTDAEQSLA